MGRSTQVSLQALLASPLPGGSSCLPGARRNQPARAREAWGGRSPANRGAIATHRSDWAAGHRVLLSVAKTGDYCAYRSVCLNLALSPSWSYSLFEEERPRKVRDVSISLLQALYMLTADLIDGLDDLTHFFSVKRAV